PTSLDCPPATLVATLSVSYQLNTGTTTRTAIDITNNNNAVQDQNHVFCGFCAQNGAMPQTPFLTAPPTPCTDKAQCPIGFKTCGQGSGGAFAQQMARTTPEPGTLAGAPLTTGGPAGDVSSGTIFCIFETQSAADAAADLPGPGAACVKGSVQLLP